MSRFEGPITLEGVETGDDRYFEPGALDFLVPSPIWYCHALAGGHDGQIQVGVFDSMERLEDGRIWATGTFMDTDDARRAQSEMAASEALGMPFGISVDLDTVSMELRVREAVLADLEGMFDPEAEEEAAGKPDANGRVTVGAFNSGDFMTVITKGLIRGATLVSMPAFKDAYVTLVADTAGELPNAADVTESAAESTQMAAEVAAEGDIAVLTLVAGGYPVAPPAEWFQNPGFTGETAIQIDDDGRIYGHAAPWGTFHIGFAGQRIEAPRTAADYAYFRTGLIRTADGTDVAIGPITMDTGHAENGLGANSALAHYDNTGTVVADVVVGEDDYGIWVSGALRPGVSDEQVRALRAAPLSGDWREIRGNLELVALLAVNTPGFVVPRMSALVASGGVRSLVASGSFGVAEPDESPIQLTREEKLELRKLVAERQGATLAESLGVSEEQLQAPETEGETNLDRPDRLFRIENAKRLARIEQAKIRALRAVKEV